MILETRPARLIAIVLALGLLSVGCASQEKASTSKSAKPSNPDFFAANQWMDQNRSGGADYWEFEGANKWTFRSEENISFVSRIDCRVGATVSWKLRSPGGEIIDEGSSQQRWPSTWRRGYAGPVVELLDQGRPGVWWVEWYVNNEHVGRSAANLVY
ncbi:MAG: hypothetical protein IIC82_06320 [Chloroflexi bacterium]|nr:hypothetical protein [Chloroflexota bacterium]